MVKKRKKHRVNISVDKELLDKAKAKLEHFGGKLSTLFNAYLSDFVESIDRKYGDRDDVEKKLKDMEERIKKLERKNK